MQRNWIRGANWLHKSQFLFTLLTHSLLALLPWFAAIH